MKKPKYKVLPRRVFARQRVVWATALALLAGLLISVSSARARTHIDQLSEAFADLFKAVNPAVVNIASFQQETATPSKPPIGEAPGVRRNLGSGLIVEKNGLIVTNFHVVQNARPISVRLADRRLFDAVLVGGDALTDIALLRIRDNRSFPVLPFGDSDRVRVGHWVLALGNPFGFNNTMTHGIVSAIGREISPQISKRRFDSFLQIDASINPGNSGGPLINMAGEVIGVNTAITAKGSGIAFAVPANLVLRVVDHLKRFGYVRRGWLGFVAGDPETETASEKAGETPTANPLTPPKAPANRLGLLVLEVVAGGPAAVAGIKKGDRLVAVGGRAVHTLLELSELIANLEPDRLTTVTVVRGERRQVMRIM